MMSIEVNGTADLDDLLHPARAFKHPMDVVKDRDLTLYEKRAILSSWASDACAIEDAPELRQLSSIGQVKFDDIMDALRELDSELERRIQRDENTGRRRRSDSGQSGGIPFF
jgi:hypothetical protein